MGNENAAQMFALMEVSLSEKINANGFLGTCVVEDRGSNEAPVFEW